MFVGDENEFKERFAGQGPVHIDVSKAFQKKIIFNDIEYNCEYAIVENAEFTEGIVFDNTGDIGKGLKFINCKGYSLIIRGCQTKGYSRQFDQKLHNIILESCEFKYVGVYDSFFERGIIISSNSNIEYLNLRRLNLHRGYISIERSDITNRFEIDQIETDDGELRFHKSDIEAQLRILNNKIPSISFTESKIQGGVFIDSCILDNLVINDSTFSEDLRLGGNTITHKFTSINTKFSLLQLKNNTGRSKGKIGEIYLGGISATRGFYLHGPNEEPLKLDLDFDKSFSGDFHFNNLEFKTIKFKGINSSANVSIDYCKLNQISIDNLNNDGLITFLSCEVVGKEPKLYFMNSSLGRTRFFNFNFAKFTNIHIVDSVLIDIICVRVTWFSEDQLLRSDLERLLNNYDNDERKHQYISGHYGIRREIYRQIKYALEKQGDRTQALRFQARELDAHHKELKFNEKRHFNDTLTLWFSRTNKMGVNWLRPLAWLFGSTVFFFLLFVWILSDNLEMYYPPKIIDFSASFSEYQKYLHILPQLFNPARVLERMLPVEEGKHLNGWIYLIDAIHRIILAFFIFQIVSAFRKYVKS